jgi:hypothetical protein
MARSTRALLLLQMLLLPPALLTAQEPPPDASSFSIVPTAGLFSFGNYFTAPGGVRFSNQDGIGYGAQVTFRVHGGLSLFGGVLHTGSDWAFEEVPLLGTVTVEGASLWFFDAGLRAQIPLGTNAVSGFAQASAGAIRYQVNNPLLTGHATNLAFSGGLGLLVHLSRQVRLEGSVKDYVASFRSVDQGSSLGVEGQRAHTLALLLGLGVAL